MIMMSDSTISVNNPARFFFTVDQDKQWKKVTLESFVKSTADDFLDEMDSILLDPEDISLRRLINDWFKDNPTHNSQQCELCHEAKLQLKRVK